MNMTAKIIPFLNPKKMQNQRSEDVFSRKNLNNQGFGRVFGEFSGNNKPDSLADHMIHMMQELDEKQTKLNEDCIQVINQTLKNPAMIEEIRAAARESGKPDYTLFALGIQTLVGNYRCGETITMTETLKQIAESTPVLSFNFMQNKIKPVVIEAGFIISLPNAFRWADQIELQNNFDKYQVKAGAKPFRTRAKALSYMCKRPFVHVQKQYQQRAKEKSANDVWTKTTRDGEVIKLSRPMKGDLTEHQKQLIRDYEAAEAESKIIEATRKLKDKSLSKEQHQLDRELDKQKKELWMQAEMDITEQQIRKAIEAEKWATYKKPAIFFLVIVVLATATTQIDKLPKMPQQALQATIPVPNSNYQQPQWGNE